MWIERDLDKMYARKKFFKIIFKGIEKDEYFRVWQSKITQKENAPDTSYIKTEFCNSIDDLNYYIEGKKYGINTYFNLATTDGKGGEVDNLKYRYCLAWDFDKKDDLNLDSKEIMFRFKALKLFYHAIVDSGNGFHVYMIINKTDDLQKVEDITKALGSILKADPNAMLKTQILRVPLTFNIKDKTKHKQVNIIHMFEENTIKPYDIDKLYKRFCNKKQSDDRTIQHAMNKSHFPPCIINMLKGVNEGDRNFAMRRIISFLKVYKYPESEGYNIIKEWNDKNNPPMSDIELNNQFKYIWEKYNYFGCITKDEGAQAIINKYCNKNECKSKSKNDILPIEGESITMEYTLCTDLRRSKKKFQLNGSHLVLISILKNNNSILYSNQLTQHLTYKGESCFGQTKISQLINELADNGYITIDKGNKRKCEKDLYKLTLIKSDDLTQFNMSYFVVLGVIKKNITPGDFRIYCFLRYRLKNGLSCTEDIIADELGISQSNVSYHIANLIKEKYIELYNNTNHKYSAYSNNYYRVNC
jgi:DNA primase large subunit/DNA-binding MarR family transcriptional regulator